MSQTCDHFESLNQPVEPGSEVCERCVEMGDIWVHLRSCLICGQVGCCDSSKNRHARAHWNEDGHPLVRSLEPGETWSFCFEDNIVRP